jgi:uncharacterized protein with GYD domain
MRQLHVVSQLNVSPDAAWALAIVRRRWLIWVIGHKRATMAMYLTRFSYTPETWARLIQNPEDRREAARAYIESVGGKLHGFWYGFGEHDGWNLWEAPDNVSMAAVVLAIGAGGALSSCETTVLLSVEELLQALGKAKTVRYRKPGT